MRSEIISISICILILNHSRHKFLDLEFLDVLCFRYYLSSLVIDISSKVASSVIYGIILCMHNSPCLLKLDFEMDELSKLHVVLKKKEKKSFGNHIL